MTDEDKKFIVWLRKLCNEAIHQESAIFDLIYPNETLEKEELLRGALVCYMLGMSAKIQDPEAWDNAKKIFKDLIDIEVQQEEEE